MPRSRGAKQSSQSSCNITVSIQGEKILIRSTDNEKSFAWLAEETERIFHDRRQVALQKGLLTIDAENDQDIYLTLELLHTGAWVKVLH